MAKFIYKTYHPIHGSNLYGEQRFLYNILQGKVEFEFDSPLDGLDGAVISIRACDNWNYVDKINEDIAKLKWCVIIITGNENSTGFYRLLKHPNMKVWVQTPKIGDEADYFLGFGWPTEAVLEYSNRPEKVRDILAGFAGQTNTQQRRECVEQLKKIPGSQTLATDGFGQGFQYPEYMDFLSRTKFACCPSAIATPDSFRIYEALEMGCVPILDQAGGNLFHFMWGNSPLIAVSNWSFFNPDLISDFETRQKECQEWWAAKKWQIGEDLLAQIRQIS